MKTKKRITLLLFRWVVMLSVSSVALADVVTIHFPDKNVTVGELNVRIPIITTTDVTSDQIVAITASLNFDPNLFEFGSFSLERSGTLTESWTNVVTNVVGNHFHISMYNLDPLVGGGALFRLLFNVRPNAATGVTNLVFDQFVLENINGSVLTDPTNPISHVQIILPPVHVTPEIIAVTNKLKAVPR